MELEYKLPILAILNGHKLVPVQNFLPIDRITMLGSGATLQHLLNLIIVKFAVVVSLKHQIGIVVLFLQFVVVLVTDCGDLGQQVVHDLLAQFRGLFCYRFC